MTSKIQLELTIKEFTIIKKALQNYKGKLEYMLGKEDMNLDMTQKILKESKVLDYLLDSVKDE